MKQLLFIPEIINHDYVSVYIKLAIAFAIIVLVVLSILIDLYFGVQKARKHGELRTSEGYKRTVNKFVFYSATMVFAFFFDVLNIFSFYLAKPLDIVPYFTLIAGGGLILTEFKSVREKAEDKARRKTDESFKQLAEALKNKDVLHQIFKQLGEVQKNKEE